MGRLATRSRIGVLVAQAVIRSSAVQRTTSCGRSSVNANVRHWRGRQPQEHLQMRVGKRRRMTGLEAAIQLETWGIRVSRYGLVLVLALIGGRQVTAPGACGIEPPALARPLLSVAA